MTAQILIDGILIGCIATVGLDIWAAFAKHVLKLPTANWAHVGRWFGHMPRGVFFHHPVAESAPIPHELAIGWIAHYGTGVFYGILYLSVVVTLLGMVPSPASALIFGLCTLIAPWLIMQPGMGAGAFASKTPRPGLVRLVNLSMHAVFGICLYVGWDLIQIVLP